jgi:hypothetical protein
MVFEDRRRLIRIAGGSELLLADATPLDVRMAPDAHAARDAGDRLSLERMLWSLGDRGQVSEIEVLGSPRSMPRAASSPTSSSTRTIAPPRAELFERYVANGADGLRRASSRSRAWNDHDLERMRALLPEGFYLDDRRRTGVGRLAGADAYLASLAAVWELSRDLRIEMLHIIGTAEHGTLYVCRWFGTNAEGGDFDAVYVCIGLLRGEEPAGMEIFELDDLDVARARFESLGRDEFVSRMPHAPSGHPEPLALCGRVHPGRAQLPPHGRAGSS